jgi:uroporphyrinogen-III synthase
MTRQVLFTGIRLPRIEAATATGVEVRHTPTIRVGFHPPADPEGALGFLARRPRVVFPSRSAVEGFARWIRGLADPPSLEGLDVWAVGEATGSEVRSAFGVVPRLPGTASGAGVGEELARLPREPVMLVVGDRRRPELPDRLGALRIEHVEVRVYRTEIRDNPELRAAFRNEPGEWILFTSPSSVEGFVASVRLESLSPVRSRLASIGPTTSREIAARRGRVAFEAARPDAAVLLEEAVRAARTGAD